MKSIYLLSFLLALGVNGDGYNTKNDGFDMAAVVADPQALLALVKCFVDEEKCPPVGTEFLKDIPDAINTSCVKCNDAQKNLFRLFIDGLKEKLPDQYEAFKNKFDPKGHNFAKLEVNVKVRQ